MRSVEKRPIKVQNLKQFLFSHCHVKESLSKHTALKVDVTGAKIYCLQARLCIFQPGNFKGCGSEGVKIVVLFNPLYVWPLSSRQIIILWTERRYM